MFIGGLRLAIGSAPRGFKVLVNLRSCNAKLLTIAMERDLRFILNNEKKDVQFSTNEV